jgi:hypothetical protein
MYYINVSLLSSDEFNFDSYPSVVELLCTTLHVTKVTQSYKHLTTEVWTVFDLVTT